MFQNCPFATMFQAFEDLWPDVIYEAAWASTEDLEGSKGQCMWDENGMAVVLVNICLPVVGAIDILCHELAHAATCAECPEEGGDHHCPAWQEAFGKLRERYFELINQAGPATEARIPE